MSPEQAAGQLDQVGKTSDVYSLGATLYCLLTGQPAFLDKDTATILEKVRRGDFPPPRQVQPRVPRALESICLRAMALRSAERYASPRLLVEDLNRWLADEAVTAHRESFGERLTRLGRRHKSAVRAAAIGLLAVATVATLAALMINQQRNRAEALAAANGRLATSERKAKEDAQLAAERNKRVLDYLVSAFRKPDPEIDGRTVTVASVLEQAPEDLEIQLANDPQERAAFLDAIGKTLVGLGLYSSATRAHERALEIRFQVLGEVHPDTLESMSNLAAAYLQGGQLDKGLSLYEQTLDRILAKGGSDDQSTLSVMNNLAAGYHYTGDWNKAIPLYEKTLELSRARIGPEHENTLSTANNLAVSYQFAGEVDKAILLLEETLDTMRAALPEDHPRTLAALNNLASANHAAKRWNKAIPLHREAWESIRAKLGDDHPDAILSLNNLAACYANAGQWKYARPLQTTAFQLSVAKLGEDHPNTLLAMHNLGLDHQAAGELDKALPLLERALELRLKKLGDGHSLTHESFRSAAGANLEARKFERAATIARQWLAAMERGKTPEKGLVWARIALAEGLLGQELLDAALQQALLARESDGLGGDYASSVLGGVFAKQLKWDEAGPALLVSYQALRKALRKLDLYDSWYVTRACERTVDMYEAQGDLDEVAAWRKELAAVSTEIERLRRLAFESETELPVQQSSDSSQPN